MEPVNPNIFKHVRTAGLKLDFPKIPMQEAIGMIFKAKSSRCVQVPKYQNDLTYNIHLQLDILRRALQEGEDRLVNARKKDITNKAEVKKRQKHLRKLENDFGTLFKKYDDFVKENEEKRVRSVQRLAYSKRLAAAREADTEELRKRYNDAMTIKGLMEGKIKEYSMYEDYLGTVVRQGRGEFRHIEEIISRYESLLHARAIIQAREQDSTKKLDEGLVKLRQLHEQGKMKYLGLMNTVGSEMERYKWAKYKTLEWEAVLYLVMVKCQLLQREDYETKQACTHMYNICCKRKKIAKTADAKDYSEQLRIVKEAVKEVDDIINFFRVRTSMGGSL